MYFKRNMTTSIKETISVFITNSEYVNTFQFLTLNYRLYSANFWYNQCEKNDSFFQELTKKDEWFPKLINVKNNNEQWNDNFLRSILKNKALLEYLYENQNPKVNIYDQTGNLIQTTNILDALENNLLGNVNCHTLNQPSPYYVPILENKKSHDLNVIQIDLDGTYLNLTNDLDELNAYIDTLKELHDKTIVIFNTQRPFFDTFDYMLYFLIRFEHNFYVCCNNGTSLYHFGFYKEHIVWSKIKNHGTNKMFLRATYKNHVHYDLVFEDNQYFNEQGIEDGKYQINDDWYISYYSNNLCNKTDLIQDLLDEYYAGRITHIINLDDKHDSTMFHIQLQKSHPTILNYSIAKDYVTKNANQNLVIYLEDTEHWIKLIDYDL